jgi:DNA-binding transcriptional ArsR family regulator
MAVAEPITVHSFLAFRDALVAAVERGAREEVGHLLEQFGERTASALATGDLDQIAELRAQGARLNRRLKRLGSESMLVAHATGQLEAFDVVLDRGRTATLVQNASEERRQIAGVLRDRIVALLATEPLRPRELAEKFDCDPSQVSRALRQLEQDGVVVTVHAPPGHSDARARWFGLVSAPYSERLGETVPPLAAR